jgi:hypothetical protein
VADKKLFVTNQGHTDIVITGLKYDTEDRGALSPSQTIAPNSNWFLAAGPIQEKLEAETPKGSAKSVPIFFYLKDAHGKNYVVLAHMLAVWLDDKFSIIMQTESVRPEQTP